MADTPVPMELLRALRSDLSPVRPLLSPSRRAAAMLPLAIGLLLLPPLYWGWRHNLAALGPALAWGPSLVESLSGVLLLGLAFRQSVPGRSLRTRWLWLALGAATLLFLAISCATAQALPTPTEPAAWMRLVRQCVGMTLLFAAPSLAVTAALVSRALPAQPALVGACYGFAVGLMTDAGVRLFCWIDEPSHVLAAHGGAILIGSVGGAVTAAVIERVKYRSLRRALESSAEAS